jgi:outer membrane lipoprotein SlyB
MRAAAERTRAVGGQLVGLHLHDANELAARSGCRLRVVRRDGKGLVVTAELDLSRINVEIEGDIVVESSSG